MKARGWIWNEKTRLGGELILNQETFSFHLSDFPDLFIGIQIPYSEINHIETYLIYNIAKKGLRIICKDGRKFDFVLPELHTFKRSLDARLLIRQ